MSRSLSVLLVNVFLFLGVAAVGMTAGCGSGQQGGVAVIEPQLVQTPDGQRAFAGQLVNQRSQLLPVVQVTVALYDDNGSRVETVQVEVNDVPARDTVSFSGVIDSDRAFRQAQVQSILTP